MTSAEREKDTPPDGATTGGEWALKCPVPRGKMVGGRLLVDHDQVDWIWVVEGSRPLDVTGPRPILRFETEEAARKHSERVWSGACRVEKAPPETPPSASGPQQLSCGPDGCEVTSQPRSKR